MSSTPRCLFALSVLMAPALTAPLVAGEPLYRSYEGTQRLLVDEPMPPSTLPDIALAFAMPAYAVGGGRVNFLDCRGVAKRGGQVRGGNSLTLDPEIINLETGEVLRNLPQKTRRFNPFALLSFALPDFSDRFPDEEMPSLGVVVQGRVAGGVSLDETRVTCAGKNRRRCDPDSETLCAGGNGRFQVTANWDNGFESGQGGVFRRTGLGGEFFFFSPSIPELTARILNGCAENGHFWVFYAATTSVEWDLTVIDTQSGESQSYSNPLGRLAPAITDTSAFATCP